MPVHKHPVALSSAKNHLDGIPLDHKLVARLEASFGLTRKHGPRLGQVFYAKLFAAAPHLRPLFRGDPAEQAAKLVASLGTIVRNLADPEGNAAMLAELGRRHAGYGAKPEHYDLVVDLLVESLREILAPHSDERTLDEWRTALRLVSKQMIFAAEASRGTAPPAATPSAR
jgi:hemoglobin-like flavoprotein